VRRREFIAGLASAAAAAWPFAARGQQRSLPTIGMLGPQPSSVPFGDAVTTGLRELGYVDGQNIRIEARWSDGRFDQLPRLASDLVRLKVDVLVTSLTQATLAAKQTTTTIPIVMAGVGDPVGAGLISSLSHPGGNVTGTASLIVDIVGKQIELLKEVVPGVTRVAVLWNPANSAFQKLQLREIEIAARATGLELQLLEASTPSDFQFAFDHIARERTRALAVLGDPLFSANADLIAKFALKASLVTVSNNRTMAQAGILLTYGPNLLDLHRRTGVYVDKILKGAVPSELPVEQPTTFELIVNLKAARTLGLTPPPTLLARADEVIE
jgi:putative tryptophan/tyrosine transport system substrate-binding protein